MEMGFNVIYRVPMFLFCLNHSFVYLLYFCPRVMTEAITEVKKINKNVA